MKRLIDRSLLGSWFGLLLSGLLCVGAGIPSVHADDAGQRRAVEQRLQIAGSYLKSKTARSITDGGNEQAREFLEKAQQFLANARQDLEAGNLDGSLENADQSIRAFSAAAAASRKRGGDSSRLAAENRAVAAEVDAYLQSFRAALADKGPAMSGLLDQQHISDLMGRAERSQKAGDHRSAGKLLNEAKQLVVVALTKIRSNETVVYTLEFQTPADEYRYERERYQEYLELSEKVLSSGDHGESKRLMFDRLRANSEDLNQEAIKLAGKGDYENAITLMEQALGKLMQGLRLLGVPISL